MESERAGVAVLLAMDGSWPRHTHHVHQSHSRTLSSVALFLSACGGAPTQTPTSEPVFEPTAIPTAAPAAALTSTPTAAPTSTPAPDTFFVDPSHDLGPISKYVYGTNHGPWVSLRPETLRDAYYGGLTIIRWPGGEWGDANDIQPYQVDTFVDLAREDGRRAIHPRAILWAAPLKKRLSSYGMRTRKKATTSSFGPSATSRAFTNRVRARGQSGMRPASAKSGAGSPMR